MGAEVLQQASGGLKHLNGADTVLPVAGEAQFQAGKNLRMKRLGHMLSALQQRPKQFLLVTTARGQLRENLRKPAVVELAVLTAADEALTLFQKSLQQGNSVAHVVTGDNLRNGCNRIGCRADCYPNKL